MFLSVRQQRSRQRTKVEEYAAQTGSAAAAAWLAAYEDFDASRTASDALISELEGSDLPLAQEILDRKDQLAKKCFWMFGGDGWAYDIGFGGLDHVVASGEDINVFVIDTSRKWPRSCLNRRKRMRSRNISSIRTQHNPWRNERVGPQCQ